MSEKHNAYPQVRLMPETVELLDQLAELIPGKSSRTKLVQTCIEMGADTLIKGWRKVRRVKGGKR